MYDDLTETQQDDLAASLTHWGNIPVGERPLKSRVNKENDDPLILAAKAGKHRYTAFKEEHGSTWIIAHAYLKEGEKRDKTGDRAIRKAIKARNDYYERVKRGRADFRGDAAK